MVDKSPWPSTTGSRRRLAELSQLLIDHTGHLLLFGATTPSEEAALEAALPDAYTVVSGPDLTEARRVIERTARQISCDAVFASGPWIAKILSVESPWPLVVDAPSLAVNLVGNDLATDVRRIREPLGWRRLVAHALSAPAQIRAERRAWRIARLITPCSPSEQALLPAAIRQRSAVVPNGCVLQPLSPRGDLPPRLVFVGTLYYQPNLEAVITLATRILAQVRHHFPEVELDVVGAAPRGAQTRLNGIPGVRLHGFVDDLAPIYAKATHAVMPLRRSTGTNVKLLEAMAHGIPVIASPPAIAGLPALRPGQDLIISTGWRDAAEQLKSLLSDRRRSDLLAISAWNVMRDHYTWDISRQRLGDALERLAPSS